MRRIVRTLAALAICLLLSACGTVQEHRARQFAADWGSLQPEEQRRLGDATIALGDTSKSVYIALGSPNYTLPFDQVAGTWTWIYWGVSSEQAAEDPGQIRFLSRSELRFPRASDHRQALRLIFEKDRLLRFELTEIDMSEVPIARTVEMGRFPRL